MSLSLSTTNMASAIQDADVEVESSGKKHGGTTPEDNKGKTKNVWMRSGLVALVTTVALAVIVVVVLVQKEKNPGPAVVGEASTSHISDSSITPNEDSQGNSSSTVPKTPILEEDSQVGTQMPIPYPTMPNIDWLFKGYDIMFGDPLEKADPGFRKTMFQATYYSHQTTDDGRFYIPDKATAHRSIACDMSFKSKVIESSQQYIDSMAVRASVKGSGSYMGVTAAFSASGGYQEASERFNEEGQVATQAEASCSVYQAEINNFDLPSFSTNFINALASLTDEMDEEVYDAFLREFGTHYVNKMTMGAMFVEQSFLSWQDQLEMEDQGWDVAVAASASGYGMAASAGVEYKEQEQSRKEFHKRTKSQETFTRGSLPPTDGNVNTWVRSVQDDPSPTQLQLYRIDQLIKPFVSDKIHSNLRDLLDGYCNKLATVDKVIASCTVPGPVPGRTRTPTPFPTPSPTRRPGDYCEGVLGAGKSNGIDLYGYAGRLSLDVCGSKQYNELVIEWRYTHKNNDDSDYPYEIFINGKSQGTKRGSQWGKIEMGQSPGLPVQIKCHAGVNYCRGRLEVKQYECEEGRAHPLCR